MQRSTSAGLPVAIGLALLVSTLSPAFAAEPTTPKPAPLFDYDAKKDLAARTLGFERRAGATIADVRFDAGPAGEGKATLVSPEGPGPFAAVLWVHWLGEPATTNRTQFLEEAVALAGRGLVSLLVDAMWSAPEWYEKRVPEQDFDASIKQVIALRRAMDLLVAQPKVDEARLGFVGHDYGAMYGMLAAGADRRAKTYVYVAATPSLLDWAFFAKQPASKADYLCKNGALELTDALRGVKNASTLFQFGTKDVYVARASTGVLLAAASAPKERKLYDAEHSMNQSQIREDRGAWLAKELGLGAPPAPK